MQGPTTMPINERENYSEIQSEYKDWMVSPWDKNTVDPMTRMKAYQSKADEANQWSVYQRMAQATQQQELKELFAGHAFLEEEHRSRIESLIDPTTSPLERVVVCEFLAVDHYSTFAQVEPSPEVREVFDYLLLDHVTHLRMFAGKLRETEGTDPQKLFYTHVPPREGRPLGSQYVHTRDLFKTHYDKGVVDPITKVHVLSMLSCEADLHVNLHAFPTFMQSDGSFKQLFAETRTIEGEHIAMLLSLIDPTQSIIETAIACEYMEVVNYRKNLEVERDTEVREVYQHNLIQDENMLASLVKMLQKYEHRDALYLLETDRLATSPQMSLEAYVQQATVRMGGMVPRGTSFAKAA